MVHELKIPILGENIKSGDVVKILVQKGDTVKKDQSVLELETEKAVLEVPSPVSGVVSEVKVKVGKKAEVGQVVMLVEEGEKEEALHTAGGQARSKKQEAEKAHPTGPISPIGPIGPTSPTPSTAPQPSASPTVRKLAREWGVNLDHITGTGPHGRITEDDIKKWGSPKKPVGEGSPDFSRWGLVEVQALSPMRKTTARHVTEAWNAIPHVTQFDSADITEVLELRKKFAQRVKAAGGNLTITAILLKIVGAALKVFPQFNASVNMESEQILYKKYFHVGVAVDTDRGLIVPVIRDVDKKNILELSVELTQAGEKARLRKTTLEEMQGGSFTITNLGSIGGSHFTPIIHTPQVAILGVGKAAPTPVWTGQQWAPRMILPLSVSYDHRVIDGADAARFLRWLADAVQEPFLMGLEG